MAIFGRRKDAEYIEFLEMEVHYLGDKLRDQLRAKENPNYKIRPKARGRIAVETKREDEFFKRLYSVETVAINYEKP